MRRAAMFARWVVGGFALGVLLALVVPTALGFRSLTVMSGSMEPTMSTGDLVLVRRISPLDARVDDVISFMDPDDPSRLITDRVREIHVQDRQVVIVTKGDANTSVERWGIDADGTLGRVEVDLPLLGYAFTWLRSPLARLLLIIVPAVALGAVELARIWRRPTDAVDGEGTVEVADAAA